ncbi:MAG: hypothetical protein ACAH80_11355 [Alphaproteobacteria bacterium]
MADKGKGSFGAQVAAVVLILMICVLCFPVPGGGLLITRLTGTDYVPEPAPVATRVADAPVEAPVIAASPPAVETAQSESSRFRQALDIYPSHEALTIPADPLDPLSSPSRRDWVEVSFEGRKVWVDAGSAMAWGPKLDVELSGMGQEDLDLAKSLCEKETPVGAWALPTAQEFDLSKVNGILKVDSGAKHKWLTWQKMPPDFVIPSARGYVPSSAGENFSVRCIARTPQAPPDGYMVTDNEISLKAMAE